MIDRIQFAMELANELNKSNFQHLTPPMTEAAVAGSVQGRVCGFDNRLADVVSEDGVQYSVKSYTDSDIPAIMSGKRNEKKYTDLIVERRISGVRNPNGDPEDVFGEILSDVHSNEMNSKEHYGAHSTKTVLIGHSEDEQYWYFRLTEYEYDYQKPSTVQAKHFTPKSKNYMVHEHNVSTIVGYNDEGDIMYDWVHPNNPTYTRCLRKRYELEDADSFFFKIEKQSYSRPDNNTLLGMIKIN